MEQWKDIKGFEGLYQISTTGKVKGVFSGKILKPKFNRVGGSLRVTLSKNNKLYYKYLGRLMIETFTPIILKSNDVVMHKNNNKTDCALSNLYIISKSKQLEIDYDTGKRFRPVYEYYDETLPLKEIAKKNNLDTKLVRHRMYKFYWNIYEAAEIPKAIYKRN